MKTAQTMPEPPELQQLAAFVDKLPPWIARKKVDYFTGGAISPKTLANDDSKGDGPKVRQLMRGAIVYPTPFFLAYLEKQGVKTIVVPDF